MKYSILIPNYGDSPYIEDCVLSAINQIDNDLFEVEIIFCDQSEKEIHNKIKKAIQQLPGGNKVTIFRLDKASILYARKELIKMAIGDYIVFLDSDDYLSDSYLHNINAFLLSNNYPDVVINNFCMVNIDKQTLDYQLPVPDDIEVHLLDYYYYSNYLNSIVRKIFKRELFVEKEVPHIDVKNGDDWLISFPIMKHAKTILFTKNTFGYFYRQNHNSTTHLFDYNTAVSSLYFKDRIIDLEMNQYQKKLYLKQKMYDYINCYRSLVHNKTIKFKTFVEDSKKFRSNLVNLGLLRFHKIIFAKDRLVLNLLKAKLYFLLFFMFNF